MGAFTYGLANLFILGGWVLLLVATIGSPVVNQISFLDIRGNGGKTTFGTFGYCYNVGSGDGSCSSSRLGYPIAGVAATTLGGTYVNAAADNATKGLILHPIAAGIAFIAQIIGLGSHRFGFLCASFIVLLAFIVSLAAMALDFALFGIIRRAVNNDNSNFFQANSNGPANYSNATWMVLAATASLLAAVVMTLFACCCGRDREERRRGWGRRNNDAYIGNQPAMVQTGYSPQRAHWWNRRNKV